MRYAEELRQSFALDPAAKIKTLSKGQKSRAGLLDRAGLSAGAARARRALLRPRSDRAPRHPRRRHAHDRRRRTHRAVLVAPARRGRAGRRSRDDDPPGHDRDERAADRDQGLAQRPIARRDFRRRSSARIPRCDLRPPHSPGSSGSRIAGSLWRSRVYPGRARPASSRSSSDPVRPLDLGDGFICLRHRCRSRSRSCTSSRSSASA